MPVAGLAQGADVAAAAAVNDMILAGLLDELMDRVVLEASASGGRRGRVGGAADRVGSFEP